MDGICGCRGGRSSRLTLNGDQSEHHTGADGNLMSEEVAMGGL